MSHQNFSTNEIESPDGNITDTQAVDRPDSESMTLGAKANAAPDKSIRTSCCSPTGFVTQTNSSSDAGTTLETSAKNLTPGHDVKAPAIKTLDFFSFQLANIENAALDKTFIFLLQIDEFGLRFATRLAKQFDWKLIPGLMELSEEACNRMLYSPHDANTKTETTQGIQKENASLDAGCISRPAESGD
jgi:hypothetical protein